MLHSYVTLTHRRCRRTVPSMSIPLPKDSEFQAGQVDIVRVLGKVDIQLNPEANELPSTSKERMSTLRIFEASIPGGTRCFLKEYLPEGQAFGKRELSVSRKLTSRWNDIIHAKSNETLSSEESNLLLKSLSRDSLTPPFPLLLGHLRPDERIESDEFRQLWLKRFPSVRPPQKGNLWLILKWDDASFKSLKRFPPLPQVVEGLDYFRKGQRDLKRWRFIRKIMRRGLEAVDFLHRAGYCHNAINGASLWMTTTNQQEINNLFIQLSDLGACQRLADFGSPSTSAWSANSLAREAMAEDLYQLGLVFMELIISSFCEDNKGAQMARFRISENNKLPGLIYRVEDVNMKQLDQRELQYILEKKCDSDFQSFREFCSSIQSWKDPVSMLERSDGAAWRMIFKLLSRGRLYDESKQRPLKISGRSLVREYDELFSDTYS
mmetsp:Transcript_31835/g.43687  ORF Transcript_31835/g.43687 Transcript_31835/m.43687 type:complete len:436 (+) Transcript_31835:161-1468(+)